MPAEFTFTCGLSGGLHARPASHLAELANEFTSELTLTNLRNGSVANLKSVLAIIAADVRNRDHCSVQASGVDEERARSGLLGFIATGLPQCDEPPLDAVPKRAALVPRALRLAAADCLFGIAASPGFARGRVVIAAAMPLVPESTEGSAPDPLLEQERVERAVAAARARIELMLTRPPSGPEEQILKAHLAIVNDVSLSAKIAERIAEGRTAGQAIAGSCNFFSELLSRSESLYIRERVLDIRDVCTQLLREICGPGFELPKTELTEPSVVVAHSLTPQEFLRMNREWLRALVLDNAGTTSHTVILARSFGIPVLAGLHDAPFLVRAGQEVVVDASRGLLVTQLTPGVQAFYEREQCVEKKKRARLAHHALAAAATVDGRILEVSANLSSPEEADSAFESGADGVGLFRTEILFAGRDCAPSEEEQFEIYVRVARAAGGRPVIIRTLDAGGDKPLAWLNLPRESNPFLGYRGARIYAGHEDLLLTQLRAIVRASAFGGVRIMAPMISSLPEVLWLKARISQVQNEMKARGTSFDPAMQVGIMIEVPSVSLVLDQMCQEVDFFSIGTNDLCQYFFAADRGNANVADLANAAHPAFLRLLKQMVDQVHQGGKQIGMCGEMAAELRHLPVLVGLGLDSISVSPPSIPQVKDRISGLETSVCQALLRRVLACRELEEVNAILEHCQPESTERSLIDRDLVLFGVPAESKEDAIRRIIEAFYVAGRTGAPDQMEEDVWKREAVYSTGLGHGFAIPHCKTDTVSAESIGILRLPKPIEWGSVDGQPVHTVVLLASRRSDANGAHLKVFSRLARRLMDQEFRDQLLGAAEAGSIVTILRDELEPAIAG